MGKPAAIMGAGGRAGTARSQLQLLEVLAETGSLVMVKPGVLVAAFTPPQFDDQGNLIDENTREIVRRHLAEFSNWVMRLVRPGEYHRFACEMDIQASAD